MSFGFSIGDFITVSELALRVYREYRDAPAQFAAISTEVGSLHLMLKDVDITIKERSLSAEKEADLIQIINGCKGVLTDLDGLLKKYSNVGKKTRWSWDRFRWHQNDIVEMRARVLAHTAILNSFNLSLTSSVTARIEKQLIQLKNEIHAGRREGSVISTRSMKAARGGDETIWLEISRELEEAGINEDKINEHRTFITTWLINAFESGQLEEKPPTAPSDGPEGDSTPLEINQDILGSMSHANDAVDAVFPFHLRHGSEVTLPEDIDSDDGLDEFISDLEDDSDGFISGAAQRIAEFQRVGREAIENADYMDAEQQLWKAMDLAVLLFGNESKRVRDCGSILKEFYTSSPLLPPNGFPISSYDRPIPDASKFDSSRLRPSSLDPSKIDLSKLSPSRLRGEHSRIDSSKIDFCRVLWDYVPESGVEVLGLHIIVRKGDIIAILSRSDPEGNPSEWWKCRTRDARIGYLPAVFLNSDHCLTGPSYLI